MNFKEAYGQLVDSDQFKKWKSDNPNFYLSHLFSKLDKSIDHQEWEIGYYDKESERITVFVVGESIEQRPSDEVFKKKGHPQELDIETISTSWDDVKKTVKDLQETSYPAQISASGFVIVQNFEGNLVWNTTLVTIAFSALNVKVDAKTGKIIDHQLTSFFDMRKN